VTAPYRRSLRLVGGFAGVFSFILLALDVIAIAGCRPNPPASLRPQNTQVASPAVFREVARSLGLEYAWGPRHRSPLTNLDTFGAGCAFADINRDGRLDVIAVGEPGIKLFLASPGGQFIDDTELFQLQRFTGRWIGIAVGDVDGDGWDDLLITGYRRLLLLRNLAGTGFVDSTAAAGLNRDNWRRWGSSAAFADFDGDGDQDLVLMNYVQFGPNAKQFCELAPGIVSGCPPREYDPEYTRVYRNVSGKLIDATIASGCNTTHGKGLAVALCDYDNDGRLDIYLGNDGTPSDLLHNQGSFRFQNVGIPSGAAFGTMGQPSAAMGADWGDFDRDGQFDLATSAFSDEVYSLLLQKNGTFAPASDRVGLGLATFKPLGFGTHFLDVDNDGRLDLTFANGHVYDNVPFIDPASSYAQPMMLFYQRVDGTLEDIAGRAGVDFATPMVGRGSAVGDYDDDGRQDLLVVDLEGRLRLYHNETQNSFHWLSLQLVGGQRGNRDAVGARVEAHLGETRLLREVSPASSYLSSSDPRLHFGLGDAREIDLLKVRWPSGRVQIARHVASDHRLVWREGGMPAERPTPVDAGAPPAPATADPPEHRSVLAGNHPAN